MKHPITAAALGLSLVAGAPARAEPVRLADGALDLVTAGTSAGVLVAARADAVGPATLTATDVRVVAREFRDASIALGRGRAFASACCGGGTDTRVDFDHAVVAEGDRVRVVSRTVQRDMGARDGWRISVGYHVAYAVAW
jgi:hypothetical protein